MNADVWLERSCCATPDPTLAENVRARLTVSFVSKTRAFYRFGEPVDLEPARKTDAVFLCANCDAHIPLTWDSRHAAYLESCSRISENRCIAKFNVFGEPLVHPCNDDAWKHLEVIGNNATSRGCSPNRECLHHEALYAEDK